MFSFITGSQLQLFRCIFLKFIEVGRATQKVPPCHELQSRIEHNGESVRSTSSRHHLLQAPDMRYFWTKCICTMNLTKFRIETHLQVYLPEELQKLDILGTHLKCEQFRSIAPAS